MLGSAVQVRPTLPHGPFEQRQSLTLAATAWRRLAGLVARDAGVAAGQAFAADLAAGRIDHRRTRMKEPGQPGLNVDLHALAEPGRRRQICRLRRKRAGHQKNENERPHESPRIQRRRPRSTPLARAGNLTEIAAQRAASSSVEKYFGGPGSFSALCGAKRVPGCAARLARRSRGSPWRVGPAGRPEIATSSVPGAAPARRGPGPCRPGSRSGDRRAR